MAGVRRWRIVSGRGSRFRNFGCTMLPVCLAAGGRRTLPLRLIERGGTLARGRLIPSATGRQGGCREQSNVRQ
jgi:hypothetical protein